MPAYKDPSVKTAKTVLISLAVAAAVAACAGETSRDNIQRPAVSFVRSDLLCQVAANKKAFIGKEIVIRATLLTDFRHYSILNAQCTSGTDALSVGLVSHTENNRELQERWWSTYCGSQFGSCNTYLDVTVRGKMMKRDDGFDFDVSEFSDVELRYSQVLSD